MPNELSEQEKRPVDPRNGEAPKPAGTHTESSAVSKYDLKNIDWAERSKDEEHYTTRRTLWPQIGAIWIAHFVIAFATGFIMRFFGLFLGDAAAETVTYVLCTLLFAVMLYVDAWHNGQQDHNLMQYGHIPEDRFRGLKAALISQLLGLVLAILAIIHLYLIAGEKAAGVPEELQVGLFWGFLSAYHLFYFPFVGVIWTLETVSPLFCLLPLVFVPVVYHIGYTLGFKGFSIRQKLMYTDPEKTKPKERQRYFK